MSEVVSIQSKSDRDRIRQRTSKARDQIEKVRSIIRDYQRGRGASSCMDEIGKIVKESWK